MNLKTTTRRSFLGLLSSTATVPFLAGLPSLQAARNGRKSRQRMIFVFSPNGTVPSEFWPDATETAPVFKRILAPLEPFRDRTLTIKGLCNKIRGDGDGHMRGMSCLLTAIELFPGNIQGGSDTPAGWASGPSIDQELGSFMQKDPATKTRFPALTLGVGVPNRADPWTRWSYSGPNQPVTPINDPYQTFEKLYGQMKDRENLGSILDEVRIDLKRVAQRLPAADRAMLDKHVTLVREMELDLKESASRKLTQTAPTLPAGLTTDNDDIPKSSAHQIELLVNALANDMTRVASVQYTNSVGQARMRWLGIDDNHHSLSHDPDLNTGSVEKLTKINIWFAEQLALLAGKLASTPEPGGTGSMLDHTMILWTNELGKGNSHTLDNIPFVLIGGGLGFKSGRAIEVPLTPHNRLWMAIAHAFDNPVPHFGNPAHCNAGPLSLG